MRFAFNVIFYTALFTGAFMALWMWMFPINYALITFMIGADKLAFGIAMFTAPVMLLVEASGSGSRDTAS